MVPRYGQLALILCGLLLLGLMTLSSAQTIFFPPGGAGGGAGAGDGDAVNTLSDGTNTLSAAGNTTLEVTGAVLSGTNPIIVTLPHRLVNCTTTVDDDNNTTAALQTLLSCSIPGGTLGTNRCLVVESYGTLQQAGTGSLTVVLNYGAGSLSNANSNVVASVQQYVATLRICGDGATNDQEALPRIYTSGAFGALNLGTMAVDSTVAQTVSLTIQFSVSSASNQFNQKWAGVRVE